MLADRPEECGRVEPWLHLFLDGECGPEERSAVEAHLAACEACAHQLALLEKTRAGLRQAAEAQAQAPDELVARVRADVAAASPSGPRRAWVAAAAALALAVIAGAGLWLSGEGAGDAPLDPVVADSVARHTLDVPVDVASPDADQVEAFLRHRVGEPVHVPRLDRVGLGLRGGRVVSVEGARAAQLIYHSGLGRRVSVTAIPDHDGRLSRRVMHRAPTYEAHRGSFAIGARRVGPTLYTVVGAVPVETVHAATLHLDR